MVFLRQMLDKIGFKSQVENCTELPQPESNRGYSPVSIIESFLVSIWCGANRFMHTEVIRRDEALKKIFGWKQSPAQDVYKRYFAKFSQATIFILEYSIRYSLITIPLIVIYRY